MMNRFKKFQIEALELAFQEREHLSRESKVELANRTGLDVEQVTCWFNRRRKRVRDGETRRTSERRNSELEQALKESREREANLQLEVEEGRRRDVELRAEIMNLRQQLASFEAVHNSDIDPIRRFFSGYELAGNST